MPFAMVEMVRLRGGLDEAVSPEELVAARLDDAHARIVAGLEPEVDTDPAPDALVAGEAMLAAAYTLRTLAARAAAERRTVKVGGQSVERGRHSAELATMADTLEAEAWEALAPFLAPPPARASALASGSTPIL